MNLRRRRQVFGTEQFLGLRRASQAWWVQASCLNHLGKPTQLDRFPRRSRFWFVPIYWPCLPSVPNPSQHIVPIVCIGQDRDPRLAIAPTLEPRTIITVVIHCLVAWAWTIVLLFLLLVFCCNFPKLLLYEHYSILQPNQLW